MLLRLSNSSCLSTPKQTVRSQSMNQLTVTVILLAQIIAQVIVKGLVKGLAIIVDVAVLAKVPIIVEMKEN